MIGDELISGNAKEISQWLWGKPDDMRYILCEYKEKRSLNSNAYFHTLVGKLRFKIDHVPWSFNHTKNYLITTYGQQEYENDVEVVIKANIPPEKMQEIEILHCDFVKYDPNDDRVAFYRVYRGSHTYNSKEMSQLIAGTIDECQRVGIPTATPDELARMAAAWEAAYARKN